MNSKIIVNVHECMHGMHGRYMGNIDHAPYNRLEHAITRMQCMTLYVCSNTSYIPWHVRTSRVLYDALMKEF